LSGTECRSVQRANVKSIVEDAIIIVDRFDFSRLKVGYMSFLLQGCSKTVTKDYNVFGK